MSYQSIEALLGFEAPLPESEHWSAAEDFLTLLSQYCLREKPGIILECSSGTSSLVLSRCCQINRQGHVYSLENGEEFASKTRQQLDKFLLTDYCDVIVSPLQQVDINGVSYQWYSRENLPQRKIDMLVIDGPPGFLQKKSRFPTLPLLKEMLAERCTVFFDDAAREDEKEIVKSWLTLYPEFSFEYVSNERGCSILKR